jgi:hypothetical protein
MLLDVAIQTLEPAMPALIAFMLSATADADQMVAIEACDFHSLHAPLFLYCRPS